MNIDIKKVYYSLFIVLLLLGSTYYAYTHEVLLDEKVLANDNYNSSDVNIKSNNSKDGVDIANLNKNNQSDKIAYETAVDSEHECTTFEKFNPKEKTCYYECADEKECTAIENKISTELESWVDEESIKEANKNKTSENEKGITAENIYAEFLILPGEIIRFGNTLKESQGRTDYYITIWDKIAALSPNELSDKYIEQFDVYKNEKDDTIAFVDDEDGNGKWRIAINDTVYRKQNEREQYMSLIHELAHIISLNKDQMLFNYTSENNGVRKCFTLYLDEGCLKEDSYLYKFYTNFKNDIWGKSEVEIKKIISNYKADDYHDYNNSFITDYAATNEVEDFAESFTYFVVDSYNYERQNLKDKEIKIASMYNYAELVKIRKQMRTALSRELLKK